MKAWLPVRLLDEGNGKTFETGDAFQIKNEEWGSVVDEKEWPTNFKPNEKF